MLNHGKWNKEEIQYLIKNHKLKSVNEIAEYLNRDRTSVINKVKKLRDDGVKYKNKNHDIWSEEDDYLLLHSYGNGSIDNLCVRLKRTKVAIGHRLRFLLGTSDVEQVSDVYRIKTITEIMGVGRNKVTKLLDGKIEHIVFDKSCRIVKIDTFWKWMKNNMNEINPYNINEDILEICPDWYFKEVCSMKANNFKLPNKPWTKGELTLLKHLLVKNLSYKEIAMQITTRTELAISKKSVDILSKNLL